MSNDREQGNQIVQQRRVVDLVDLVSELPALDAERFRRLFDVREATGSLFPPDHMLRWIERYFGSVNAVTSQRLVKITNRWTLDETLFNELRSRRPIEARIPADLADEIAKTAPDPFCEPTLNTPADTFGRIRGRRTITASNIAKYDGLHGLIVFDEHDPLAFTEDLVVDALQVAQRWFAQGHQVDPSAVYPFFMWNCLWKAGASIPHGHAQVSLTRGMHYGKVERQRRAALEYRRTFDTSYFDDLLAAHRSLGLAAQIGDVSVLVHLTPLKEKEIVLLAPRLGDELAQAVYRALHCIVGTLGVVSFNLALWMPPLGETGEDWSDFPVMVRIVDRGDPLNRTSDFGAMELYAASVVASDPFRVAEVLLPCL